MAQTQTAYQKPLLPDTHPAAADLSAKQFYAAKTDTDGAFVLGTAGDASDGPIQIGSASGGLTTIERLGISKFVAGAAVRAGYFMEVTTGGKYIELSSGKCVGKCVVGASADLAIGSMLVFSSQTSV